MGRHLWAAALVGLMGALVSGEAGAAQATRVSAFEYSATTGLLTKEIIEPDDPQARVETTYTYDAFGNKVGVTVSSPATGAAAIASRTTTSTYDAQGRFATAAANALSQSETHVFDTRFGAPTSLTGPNGLTTTWQYDGFGRKTLEIRADGTRTKWEYLFCAGVAGGSATCPGLAKYLVRTTPLASDGTTQNGPLAITYFDVLNREIRSETQGFDGTPVLVDTEYDALGRVHRQSHPYYTGATPVWTTNSYDVLGRITVVTEADGGTRTTAYAGLVTTVTNALNQTQVTTLNSQGQTVSVEDELNGTTSFAYDPFGNLVQTTDAAANVTTATFDIRGRKTAMDDPDMGVWSYGYNVLGELISQTDAKAQTVTMAYDLLGRMVSRNEAEGLTLWTYDSAAYGIGKPHMVVGPNGHQETYSYDSLGRPSAETRVIAAQSFTTSTTYDTQGRTDQVTYPSGFAVENNYTSLGYLASVQKAGGGTVYWQATTVNAEGQVTAEMLGNGVTTARGYDPLTGLIDTIQTVKGAATIQNLGFDFDKLGNLTARSDVRQNRREAFAYDGLNRVTSSTLTNTALLTQLNQTTYAYDSIGNITAKSDVGAYTYGQNGAGPHAVTTAGAKTYAYDANGSMVSGTGRSVTWSSFNMPVLIQDTAAGNQTSFTYGPDRARVRQQSVRAGQTTTVTYVGSLYEQKVITGGNTDKVHYIRAGSTVAIYTIVDTGSATATKTRYLHRDHLGSIESITDEAGLVTEYLSYDAHGQRRLTDWQAGAPATTALETPRGFTGHEHLDGVGLIHMNGRVYDPVLGRFLSADPFVQDANDTQALNRYTYVNNNPLSYTDPSGFFFKKIAGFLKSIVQGIAQIISNPRMVLGIAVAIIAPYALGPVLAASLGSYATFAANVIGGALSGAITSGNLEGALHGAITAAAFYGVGNLTKGHFYPDGAGGMTNGFQSPDKYFGSGMHLANIAGHAAVGCASQAAAGGKCGAGALAGAVGALAGPKIVDSGRVAGTAISAVVGGTASVAGGGKFANGAITGAFGYLFNDYITSDSHEYDYGRSVCSVADFGCTPEVAFDGLLRNQYPGQPQGQIVKNGGRYYVFGNERAPIKVLIVHQNFTAVNVTELGHPFYFGLVYRSIEQRNGLLYVHTYGIGNNSSVWNAAYNYGAGVAGFGGTDARIMMYIREQQEGWRKYFEAE